MVFTQRVFNVVISVVLVFSFVQAYAQQTTGTISGVVTDETGGVIPGVEVTARNTETGAVRTVVSDDLGRYRLFQLAVGAYELCQVRRLSRKDGRCHQMNGRAAGYWRRDRTLDQRYSLDSAVLPL